MQVTTISKFRKDTKKYFDQVLEDHVPLLLTRSDGKTLVIRSLEDDNAMRETAYLLSSPANRRHLDESIAQLNRGEGMKKTSEDLKG